LGFSSKIEGPRTLQNSDFNRKCMQSRKRCDRQQLLPRSAKTSQQSWTSEFGPTQIDFCGRSYFVPYGVLCLLKCVHALENN